MSASREVTLIVESSKQRAPPSAAVETGAREHELITVLGFLINTSYFPWIVYVGNASLAVG